MSTLTKTTSPLKATKNVIKNPSEPSADMSKVCSIILAGGQGTRLFPLTQRRCKPAIIFGGRYLLIDVPASNALNSQVRYNFVVTQFLSSSLHQHIFQAFRAWSPAHGSIEILGAEQKPDRTSWFQGTADAVRQNIEYLKEIPAEYFLILSGDQLYRMDFKKMVQYAIQKDVDVVVATLAVDNKDAKRMGIMKINEDHHIIDFHEKPDNAAILERLKTPSSVREMMGLPLESEKQYLASMGIYLFRRNALFELLQDDPREDFGKHLIPTKVKSGSIAAFAHNDYWEDIGTIDAFYKANIALTQDNPPFDCYDERNPIHTLRLDLPGPKIVNTSVHQSIICEGSVIEAKEVVDSVLGQRTHIMKGSSIIESYIMGNDSYKVQIRESHNHPEIFSIGENSVIKRAIIDRNVHIGNRVQLINKNNLINYDGPGVFIRDGIIVVPRGSIIPDGFVL